MLCNHSFTVPINVLSMYPGVSATDILLSTSCLASCPIHICIVLFISVVQSKSKNSEDSGGLVGVHLFNLLCHIASYLLSSVTV